MSTIKPLRIGILGAGKIALDHVAALHTLGHTVAVGSATSMLSPRWQSFAKVAPEARFEPDGKALVDDPEVDAIVACLPWNLTERWLPLLLATLKPVLIEKPIALSSQTLRAVLAGSSLKLDNKFVGFNRRFYVPVQKMRERLNQGGLKAAEITVSEALGRLVERYGQEIIGYILAYSSCHILDTALYLLGPLHPARVYGYDDQGYPAPFRSLNGLLETKEEVPVALAINADDPCPVGIRFRFDDRTAWVLSPMERLVGYCGYEISERTPEFQVRRYRPKAFFESTVEKSSRPGFVEQMRAFTTGEGREIAATPKESMQLLILIESIQQAALQRTQDMESSGCAPGR